jgi:1-acyl-sn-glycerol-3-phosphate acyltransferase
MPTLFDPDAFLPWRTAAYMAVARGFFLPIYVLRNRLTVEGQENIPPGPCVAVANHLSNWDPPLVSVCLNRPICYLAKKELYEMPGVRQFLLFFGNISVDREHPELSTFKAVKRVFAAGWSLGMFIEGTRSRTPGVLGQPHQGPAYFAFSNKVPLVPVGITGTGKTYGKYLVRIGTPITPERDLDATTNTIMAALSALTGFALPEKDVV